MPKAMITTRDNVIRSSLFYPNTIMAANLDALSKATHIPARSLRNKRNNPGSIKIDEFFLICRAMRYSGDDVAKIYEEWKKAIK